MAKLQSDKLILEVKFKQFEDEWIEYEIVFYWKDDIIVNDNILKRTGWWDKRNTGHFLASDYEKDTLIETIKKVLMTNESEYWEPLEPDAKIAIYPEKFFPFLKSHWDLEIEEKKQIKNDIDDLFTVIAFIDTYNMKDSCAYSGEGISMHLIVKRKDLEEFVKELEIEYIKTKNSLIKTDTI